VERAEILSVVVALLGIVLQRIGCRWWCVKREPRLT
jgi:preprotein translocase subunit Sec63